MTTTTTARNTRKTKVRRARPGNALQSLRQRVQAHTRASTRRKQARRDAK